MGTIITSIATVLVTVLVMGLVAGLLYFIFRWRKGRRDACGEVKDNGEDDDAEFSCEGMDNTDVMRALLKKLNCESQEEADDDGCTFMFTYQGEKFWMYASKKTAWVRVADITWYECPLDNLEELSCMQKAINIANSQNTCTALYTIDNDEHVMSVYSKYEFAIYPKFLGIQPYFTVIMGSFFELKHAVAIEFDKEKSKVGVTD